MSVGMFDDQGELLDDLVVPVDLDDPRVARFANHRVAVFQPLEGMNLNALVALGQGLRIVLPNDLLRGRHFFDPRVAHVQQEVAAGQHGNVVRGETEGNFPCDGALLVDDDDVTLVLGQDFMRNWLGSAGGREENEKVNGNQKEDIASALHGNLVLKLAGTVSPCAPRK